MPKSAKLVLLALAFTPVSRAQVTPAAGTPARMIVTVGHYYGHETSALTRDNVVVTEGYDPIPVTNVVPVTGDRAGLELFLLVDNCSNCEPGSKFEESRRFIVSQPLTTAVGVAYIDNGRLKVAENPTQDRERAIGALSVPAGSNPSNPFIALTELIQGWRTASPRRMAVMISNGIDPAAPDSPLKPSTEAALAAAQRAGVIVYAIYHPSVDYLTGDLTKVLSGQTQLAHLASETGGEAYFLTLGPLPSLAPFLTDMAGHLAHQNLVEILANPEGAGGALEKVRVTSKFADVDLMAPDKIWVPGFKPIPSKDRVSHEATRTSR